MRAYEAYSNGAGIGEGAALIFANTAREAKKIAWRDSGWLPDMCGEYTDLRVFWIRDNPKVFLLANQDKLKANQPHLIDSPLSCKNCGWWGVGLNNEGLCNRCNQHPGNDLVKLLKESQIEPAA